MWAWRNDNATGVDIFFYIGQSHDALSNHYELNFNLMKHHNFSLSDIEDMMPYERDVYVLLLRRWIEEENARIEKQAARQ